MLKTIYLIIPGLLISILSLAQPIDYKVIGSQKKDVPMFILNGNIIMGDYFYFLDSADWKTIVSIDVIKGNDEIIPTKLKNQSKYGIVVIRMPYSVETKTVAQIKNWFGLDESGMKVAADGFILEDDSLEIATCAINEIVLIKEMNKVTGINIWTLCPENRNGITLPKAKEGQVRIR